MSFRSELLVVCGLHRSGTTFVGEILRHAGVCVVHEPLNERFGVVGVPIAYPLVDAAGGIYSTLIAENVAFRRKWNRSPESMSLTWGKRQLYLITGGRSGLRWSLLRLRRLVRCLPPRLCWKDPFATLATPYLLNQIGARVVCMVRHPAAVFYSTEKRGWSFDVENLRRQSELIEHYGIDIPASHWVLARRHHAASIALLWKFMHRVNAPYGESNDKMLIVKHEDFCHDPTAIAERICAHLRVPFTRKMKRFVIEHTEADKSETEHGDTHDFSRNCKTLPEIWRGRVNAEDESMIRTIVQDEFWKMYDKW